MLRVLACVYDLHRICFKSLLMRLAERLRLCAFYFLGLLFWACFHWATENAFTAGHRRATMRMRGTFVLLEIFLLDRLLSWRTSLFEYLHFWSSLWLCHGVMGLLSQTIRTTLLRWGSICVCQTLLLMLIGNPMLHCGVNTTGNALASKTRLLLLSYCANESSRFFLKHGLLRRLYF